MTPNDQDSVALAGKGPVIRKLGTIDCDIVETTPLVWRGRLYRFEYIRKSYYGNATGESYFRLVDVATGAPTAPFAHGHHMGVAHAQGDRVYVYGIEAWGAERIIVFWSDDLQQWQSAAALTLPGWGIYNTSVCKTPEGYAMAIELGEPPEVVGVRFTIRFALSADLVNWTLVPEPAVHSKDRYTACPALRWLEGWYYMIYLEYLIDSASYPSWDFAPFIVRSRDLIHWESSPFNPILKADDGDRRIANPNLSDAQRREIAHAENANNSDVDLCEFDGRTVITYSWGNQRGIEFLAEAVYEGPMGAFLKGHFPNP